MAKTISNHQITGERGIALIRQRVLAMGHVFHPTGALDAGIDGYIEIRDRVTGEVTNLILQVQSKATGGKFLRETETSLEYVCDERDLQYWLRGNSPVVLVVSRPDSDEAYWVSIKDYFRNPKIAKERKVKFDKQRDSFVPTAQPLLERLAMPRDAGIYLAPPPRAEKLFTNLVPVSFPPTLFRATTDVVDPTDLLNRIRSVKGERPRGAFHLKGDTLVSFLDLAESPWDLVADAVEEHDTDQWAASNDADTLRDFVGLLNRCLEALGRTLDLRFDREHRCFHFKATPDLRSRKIDFRSVRQDSARTVFKKYAPEGKTLPYYRHLAFERQFVRYGSQWYLTIEPTYFFTTDGHQTHPYAADRLKGIKKKERNPAVRQLVVFWADYLRQRSRELPFEQRVHQEEILGFGDLATFDVDFGVDDRLWLGTEEDEGMTSPADSDDESPESPQQSLFAQ